MGKPCNPSGARASVTKNRWPTPNHAALARARLAVGYLVGREAEAPSLVAVSAWPKYDSAEAAAYSEAEIEARADVRAARARVDAADKARELAQALRKRDVSVGAQYEHWPNQADGNNQGTGNSFGLAVSVPLFLRQIEPRRNRRQGLCMVLDIEKRTQPRAIVVLNFMPCDTQQPGSQRRLPPKISKGLPGLQNTHRAAR